VKLFVMRGETVEMHSELKAEAFAGSNPLTVRFVPAAKGSHRVLAVARTHRTSAGIHSSSSYFSSSLSSSSFSSSSSSFCSSSLS
jgi:hypothetical protein